MGAPAHESIRAMTAMLTKYLEALADKVEKHDYAGVAVYANLAEYTFAGIMDNRMLDPPMMDKQGRRALSVADVVEMGPTDTDVPDIVVGIDNILTIIQNEDENQDDSQDQS